MENIKLIGCDTCSITVESNGSVTHEGDCLRQKYNRLRDKVTESIKSLNDEINDISGCC